MTPPFSKAWEAFPISMRTVVIVLMITDDV
jgi:hypothetical protein